MEKIGVSFYNHHRTLSNIIHKTKKKLTEIVKGDLSTKFIDHLIYKDFSILSMFTMEPKHWLQDLFFPNVLKLMWQSLIILKNKD